MRLVCSSLLAIALIGCSSFDSSQIYDLFVRGGLVVDGTGIPPYRADVLVRDGIIAHIGAIAADSVRATETIDATGRLVAPGFIDVHAHGDAVRSGTFRNFIAMGVTTICLGQDGVSPGDRGLAAWLKAMQRPKLCPNVAPFVGHATVRERAGIALDAEPTDAQLARMQALIQADLQAGAWGLTTGLEYEPGRFATARELARIARPVAARRALVMSHIRSEDDALIDGAIDELLEQCRSAGCAAHVSHLKIVHAHEASRAGQLLERLRRARQDGLRVTADAYPYIASFASVGLLFPDWARPPAAYVAVVTERREELAAFLRQRVQRRNGPAATVFGSGPFAGKSLEQVATELGKPFEDVLIDDVGPDGADAAFFVMAPEVMERLLLDEHVMIGSDGSPTMRHPRGYGTFARVIREFVVAEQALTIEEAVRKMTSLPAKTIGMTDRGRVAEGLAADLVV
ncbi:MAG: amidohydrolase family protein, partial [Planctomycetes bacterium]|nr:amidohydrolase family protein [Planctomycetota bacterium]